MKDGDKVKVISDKYECDGIPKGSVHTVQGSLGSEIAYINNAQGKIGVYSSDLEAVTSHHCKKHNHFYSTGDWCPECAAELKEYLTEREEVSKEMTDEAFSHQSARHNEGKVQLREIDPAFITGLGEVLTASRAKYDEGNWMKETKFSTPYESAMRHLMKFWDGQELDDETTKHHLLHAATNLMFLYYHTRSGKGIDDRLFKKERK